MFDELMRELERLEGTTSLPVQLPLDDNGYLDRMCPNASCQTLFKVRFTDWRDKVPQERVRCPICGHSADATDWNTPEQSENLKSQAVRRLKQQLGEAISRDVQSFNRRQPRGGFVSMSLEHKPGPEVVVVPIAAYDALNHFYECSHCNCHYSSTGPAFFCPACGDNSAEKRFETSVFTSIHLMENVDTLRQDLRNRFDAEVAENTTHLVVETTFANLVAAFQSFAESAYSRVSKKSDDRSMRNVFQNLQRSNELWSESTGYTYTDLIGPTKHAQLSIYFQRRHLLVHRDAIVDSKYVQLTADDSYKVGERLVTTPKDVVDFAKLLLELSHRLNEVVPAVSELG